MSNTASVVSVPLEQLDERYSHLRLPKPQQEDVVAKSLGRYGQLTPVVASSVGEVLAVVDGFKRLHAAQKIGLPQLDVRVFALSEQAAVAAIYSLNRHNGGLADFEEALVVRELCRKHSLAQLEVAELLGRHKSWVCRRLMLVERLSEQVQSDMRVGLVSGTVAREVARLPRGNQSEVAIAVHRHGLTSREAALLVTLFEKAKDRTQQQELLERPRQALERHQGRLQLPPYDPRLSRQANQLRRLVMSVLGEVARLRRELVDSRPSSWTGMEQAMLRPPLRQIEKATSLLGEEIRDVLDSVEQGNDA